MGYYSKRLGRIVPEGFFQQGILDISIHPSEIYLRSCILNDGFRRLRFPTYSMALQLFDAPLPGCTVRIVLYKGPGEPRSPQLSLFMKILCMPVCFWLSFPMFVFVSRSPWTLPISFFRQLPYSEAVGYHLCSLVILPGHQTDMEVPCLDISSMRKKNGKYVFRWQAVFCQIRTSSSSCPPWQLLTQHLTLLFIPWPTPAVINCLLPPPENLLAGFRGDALVLRL